MITTKFFIPLLLLSLALLFCLTTVSAASNDAIYVNGTGGNDSWDGQSWQTAKLTIKNAAGTVNANGNITIAKGTYTGENNTNITIGRNMTLIGESQTNIIIDAQGQGRIFYINSGVTVNLYNLTLQNGHTDENTAINNYGGGAILNDGTLNVSNCTFTGNTAASYPIYGPSWVSSAGGDGAAILNYGTLAVNGSMFISNTADTGGAIYNSGTLAVNGSTFTGNTADGGGAIANLGTMTVTGSTFASNTVYGFRIGYGGAITNLGTLNVTGSTFTNNKVDAWGGSDAFGGAIFNEGTLNVTGSTFTGNTAGGDSLGGGGAIANYGGDATIKFNRIVGNTASLGSVIYNGRGTVDATLNWWDSNADPAGKMLGYILCDPWIILTVAANPTTINFGGTSQITADLLHDSSPAHTYHNPTDGHVPDGIPITLTLNPVWGTIIDIVPTYSTTLNGKVEANYHTGSLPIQTPVRIYANVDSEQDYMEVNILTSTSLTVNSPTGYNGDTVDITATLTRTDTGVVLAGKQVTITVNGQTHTDTTDSNGQVTWSYTINNMNAGQHNIHIAFDGDTQYAMSTGDGTLTVDHIPTSLTEGNAGGAGSFKDQTVNIQATLRDTAHGNTPVGGKTINFTITGDPAVYHAVTDVNGVATLVYTIIQNAGTYNIHATFTGDSQYSCSSSNPDGTLTVDAAPTNVVVVNVYNFPSQNVTLTADVTDFYGHSVNEGSVKFTVNGSYVDTVPVNNGEATLNWQIPSDWSTGNYTILAEYLGTGNFNASNSTGNLTVDATPTSITVRNVTGVNSKTVNLDATLTDVYGHPLTGKTINFKINGNNIGNGTTDSNGIATLNYKLNSAGNFTVTAEFAGDSGYVNSISNGTLAVDPSSGLYIIITSNKNNQKVDETFTLTYKLGNNGPNSADNVTITIPLPDGFEVSQITGDGKWTYNSATRTITWNLENVPVGDPYLYITGKILRPGSYVFSSSISSETYNIGSQGVTGVTIYTVSQVHAANKTSKKVKAIPLQHTGLPLTGLILAVLAVCGGLITSKKF